YFAWTREQRAIETTTESELYAVAQANARRVARGELAYLTGADRRLLQHGQALTTAHRELGDVLRAAFVLALVSGMATAYRLPGARTKRRTTAKKGRRSFGGEVADLATARAQRG